MNMKRYKLITEMLSFFGPMDATPTSVHTSSGEGVACFTEWRR